MSPTPRPPASRLEQLLRSRQFVITVRDHATGLLQRRRPLAQGASRSRGLADAVNVTDGATAKPHLSSLARGRRTSPAPASSRCCNSPCRDRNRIALQGDLLGTAACGVHNILCLTGDDPKPATSRTPSRSRPRFGRAAAWRATCATRASSLPGARSRAPPRFSWVPPTCRSTPRPTGSPTTSRPSSPPAPNSCRRNIASTPVSCAATAPPARARASRGVFLLVGVGPLARRSRRAGCTRPSRDLIPEPLSSASRRRRPEAEGGTSRSNSSKNWPRSLGRRRAPDGAGE